MLERTCSKIGCAREAVGTLTYDYGDRMVAVGPLGRFGDPHAHDLCSQHIDRLSAPQGWTVMRYQVVRG